MRQELRDLQKDARETARKIDRLTFILQEINDAKLKLGEEDELKAERDLLAHAETRATLADEAYQALYGGGEDEKGALDLLNQAMSSRARSAKSTTPKSKPPSTKPKVSRALMDDLARTLRDYRDSIEFNPKRLEQIEDRLDLIFRLKRKYGDTIEQVLEFGKTSQQELDAVTHAEERMNELREQDARLVSEAGALAEKLSQARAASPPKNSRAKSKRNSGFGHAKSPIRRRPQSRRGCARTGCRTTIAMPLNRAGLIKSNFSSRPIPANPSNPSPKSRPAAKPRA